jgi:hypothetical protein
MLVGAGNFGLIGTIELTQSMVFQLGPMEMFMLPDPLPEDLMVRPTLVEAMRLSQASMHRETSCGQEPLEVPGATSPSRW